MNDAGMASSFVILAGFLLDALLGDPVWLPHPVRVAGFLAESGERLLRRLLRGKELLAGFLLVVFVGTAAFAVPFVLLMAAYRIDFRAGFALGSVFSYQALAARGLKSEAMKVYRKVEDGDLRGARFAVSMIVGRDTERLSMEGVIRAAVETVAENLSDGVIAPLFFLQPEAPRGRLWLFFTRR